MAVRHSVSQLDSYDDDFFYRVKNTVIFLQQPLCDLQEGYFSHTPSLEKSRRTETATTLLHGRHRLASCGS